eukprot:403331059
MDLRSSNNNNSSWQPTATTHKNNINPNPSIVVNLRGQQKNEQLQQLTQSAAVSYQWDILWFDHGGLTPEFLSSMLPWQRVNHFLGMYNISRKNTLGIHLKRFLKEFPLDYKFFPNTWLYPTDFYEINEYYMNKANKRKQLIKDGDMTEQQSQQNPIVLFICKPEASCQGKGIFIVKRLDDMRLQLNSQLQAQLKQYQEYIQAQEYYDTAQFYSQKFVPGQNQNGGNQQQQIFSVNQDQSQFPSQVQNQQQNQGQNNQNEPPQYIEKQNTYVIQKYMKNPALIKGHKFDFRIYVLITSVIEPLSIFVFRDGLVRLASEKYDVSKNIQDMYVHLTNYSLNKKNEKFDGNKHKLTLSECLKGSFTTQSEKGSFSKSSEQIWTEIDDIVIKTVITIQPQLQHYYRSSQPKEPDLCYELLGFDIILDYKLRPWLLEVNHLPSFNSDTTTDEQVKKKVHKELKADQMRQSLQQGCFKRLSVKEHVDRVRFDPSTVANLNPQNKFKLIYPKPSGTSSDNDDYEKYQRKANEIWQLTTGTMKQPNLTQVQTATEKKKKKVKSRHRKQSQQLQQQTVEQIIKESLQEKPYQRKISEQEVEQQKNKQQYQGLEELENDTRRAKLLLSASKELSKDQEQLLSEKQADTIQKQSSTTTANNQIKTQNSFFDKRQSSNLRQTLNNTNKDQQNINKSATTVKSNTQRQSIRSNIRQPQQSQRPNQQQRNGPVNNNQIRNLSKEQTLNQQIVNAQVDGLQQNDASDNAEVHNVLINQASKMLYDPPPLHESIDTATLNYNGLMLEDTQSSEVQMTVQSPATDILIKLSQNKSTLKYKEYCKALIDDFNSSYYKSSYKNNSHMQPDLINSMQNQKVSSEGQGINNRTAAKRGQGNYQKYMRQQQHGQQQNYSNNGQSNNAVALRSEMATNMNSNQYNKSLANNNQQMIQQPTNSQIFNQPQNPQSLLQQQQQYQNNFGLGGNQYIKKLKTTIQSQNNRQSQHFNNNGINQQQFHGKSNRDGVQRSGLTGYPIGEIISPASSNQNGYIQSKSSSNNPFQQSLIRSKEDLAIYNMGLNQQRILLRSDSLQNYQRDQYQNNSSNNYQHIVGVSTVDMAPINLSAGIIDFKVQYRKHHGNKRFNTNSNISALASSYAKSALKHQQIPSSITIQNTQNQGNNYKNQTSPKIQLQFVNANIDNDNLNYNYLTHTVNNIAYNPTKQSQSQFKNKREQKNSRIISIEQQYQDSKNLDRLKQFEQKLLSKSSGGTAGGSVLK